LPLGHWLSAVQKQFVCVGSHESFVPPYPLVAAQEKVPPLPSEGMPVLVSSQSKPSRLPLPLQLEPQETSFSPATLTHLPPLLHCESLEQKQPPGLEQSFDAPLQLPKAQLKPLPAETGQPPSGQSRTAPSGMVVLPGHWPAVHVSPGAQAALQAPQLALSVW
jgi:hypothetical protein